MTDLEIARKRLSNQRITQAKFATPSEVVSWLGALQAQDYTSVRWAVGLRCASVTEAGIEKAIAERAIVRTWLLRGTLHLVSPHDVRWILGLLAPRLIAGSAGRNRQLELDAASFTKSFQILTKKLEGGTIATRGEMMAALEAGGISTAGQRGYHILAHAALEGLICFGPRQAKQQTFVLLDEWAPQTQKMERDEALAELARRYFSSHGPAGLTDFTWWSGLTATEARKAVEMVKMEFQQETVNGQVFWARHGPPIKTGVKQHVHLLPAFDEYFIGYSDRSAILDPRFDRQLVSSNGVFRPMLVIDGQVVGTWKQELTRSSVNITLLPLQSLSESERDGIAVAAEQYGNYLGLTVKGLHVKSG